MRRREAARILLAGAASGPLGLLAGQNASGGGTSRPADSLVDKVKLAMLTMQRHAWEQGVAMQALLEWGERDLVIMMSREAVLRIWPDGRLGQVWDNHGVTDPAANGEGVLWAARETNDPAMKSGADRMIDYLLHKAPRTGDGTLYHIDNKRQVWIDSMYMAPPFLAAAGAHAEALKQVDGFRKLLWNEGRKLFSHIWDDDRDGFERQDFWGVGNGWAAAGMSRVLKALPGTMKAERRKLADHVREVLDGCLRHRRSDGLFHDVVDKPGTFVETNLSQMLAYTIYRGVAGGWLPRSYLEPAGIMRAAARAKVDDLGYVRDVCGSPTFEAPGTATEGQAFFILMEAAARDLEA
jgi:unsaturated rhamnogalacturonyl hydrolase